MDGKPLWIVQEMDCSAQPDKMELRNLSFQINAGDRVSILSKSSFERSLLLRTLGGLRPIRKGLLEIFGKRPAPLTHLDDWDQLLPRGVRKKFGMCLENEGLVSNVSVREGMELLFRFKSGHESSRNTAHVAAQVSETCELFQIQDIKERRPFSLSLSERRLAGIARAWVSKPKALLLEEPTRGLTENHRKVVYSVFSKILNDSDQTLVATTDDWLFAKQFCLRWIVIENGQIVFDGSRKDFFQSKNELITEVKSLRDLRVLIDNLLGEVA